MDEIVFRLFHPGDETAFRELNEAWIAPLFGIEQRDREVLGDPVAQILKPGGHIVFATVAGRPVGCCALVFMAEGEYELSKMTVAKSMRGSGAGRSLLASPHDRLRPPDQGEAPLSGNQYRARRRNPSLRIAGLQEAAARTLPFRLLAFKSADGPDSYLSPRTALHPVADHFRGAARFFHFRKLFNRPPHLPAPVRILRRRSGQILLVRLARDVFLIYQPQRARSQGKEPGDGVMNLRRQFGNAARIPLVILRQELRCVEGVKQAMLILN